MSKICITFIAFETYLKDFLEFICVTVFGAELVSNTTLPLKLINYSYVEKFMTLYFLLYKSAKFALNFALNLFFFLFLVFIYVLIRFRPLGYV